jgi:hypothetical protein
LHDEWAESPEVFVGQDATDEAYSFDYVGLDECLSVWGGELRLTHAANDKWDEVPCLLFDELEDVEEGRQ